MRHASLEQRLLRRDVVHVRVEEVAADAGEVDDIRLRHRASMRDKCFADLELVEVFPEGMNAVGLLRCAGDVFVHDPRQRRR